MGSFPPSREKFSSRAKPKSDTFAELSSATRTFLAARSLCTTCLDSKYAMPAHVSLKENENTCLKVASFDKGGLAQSVTTR